MYTSCLLLVPSPHLSPPGRGGLLLQSGTRSRLIFQSEVKNTEGPLGCPTRPPPSGPKDFYGRLKHNVDERPLDRVLSTNETGLRDVPLSSSCYNPLTIPDSVSPGTRKSCLSFQKKRPPQCGVRRSSLVDTEPKFSDRLSLQSTTPAHTTLLVDADKHFFAQHTEYL